VSLPDTLSISEERVADDVRIVAVGGDVTFANAEPFGRTLLAALGQGTRHLVVDLSKVEFMDSSGLAALLAASRTALGNAARISLVQRPEAPLNVLRFKGIERLVGMHDSREAALASVPAAG